MKKEVLLLSCVAVSVLCLLTCFGLKSVKKIDCDVEEKCYEVISEKYLTDADITVDNGELTKDTDEKTQADAADEAGSEETVTEKSDEEVDEEITEKSDEDVDEEITEKSDDSSDESSEESSDEEKKENDSDVSTDEETTGESDENIDEDMVSSELDDAFDDEIDFDAIDGSLLLGSLKAKLTLNKETDVSLDEEFEDYDANGNKVTYNKVYATVADMAAAKNIQIGHLIRVKGYYAADDGGIADYQASDTAGAISVKLANGLYANLVFTDSINIRQVGAVGDGKSDDSAYLTKALGSGASTVVIPEGTFNLNCKEIAIPHGVAIVGKGSDKSTLLNLNFRAHYGLTLRELTCKGAYLRAIWNTCEALSARTMFCTSPKGAQNIEYTNCVFTDTDYVSWAITKSEGYFENDTVTGCTFTNIGCCAIYHGVNTVKSSYTGNTFRNIGSRSASSGQIAAIWVGDIANVNFTQAKNIDITGNTFENLYTADEFDESVSHCINANFIAVRADIAVISKNTIKNLVGYGHDREAVYTKVRCLTVKGNYIKNGGSGEGYICNKGQDGYSKALIKNNNILGDYGCGIRNYGTAEIYNNTISIKHCIAAIYTTQRDGQTGSWPMEVIGNKVSGGAGEPYKINGHTIDNYSSGVLVKIIKPINNVKITDNVFTPQSAYVSYLSVANSKGSVSVLNNEFNIQGLTGNAINIYDQKSFSADANQTITISNNKIYSDSGTKNVVVKLESVNSTRKITYSENEITVNGSGSKSTALSCSSGSGTRDQLLVSGNSTNVGKKSMYVTTNVKKITYNDDSVATLVAN